MTKSIYYFARVDTEKMNEFENFLIQREIVYSCISHFFFQKSLSMVYGINLDKESLSVLKLAFSENEVHLSNILEYE